MKILMKPHLSEMQSESGIKRVIEAYFQELPKLEVELVTPDCREYDLLVCHAGSGPDEADVSVLHGLYWTRDYQASDWEYQANAKIIKQLRYAKQITVPSPWVAETFQRDMRINPTVVPHGIYLKEWNPGENGQYVLFNKNRTGDVCSPDSVKELALRNPEINFLSTFAPEGSPNNVRTTGVVSHETMAQMIQNAGIYLSTTKETFGIGILEAMASAVPVLGYAQGGILDLVKHGVNGYLAKPGDYEDLNNGLYYCMKYRKSIGG